MIKVETLAMCLMVVPNDLYLEDIGFDTLVFKNEEGKKIVLKQKELVKEYINLRNQCLTNKE